MSILEERPSQFNVADIVYTTDTTHLRLADLDQLFQSVDMGQRDFQSLRFAIDNSAITVTAFYDNKLCGTARAVSDNVFYAGIFDVAVVPCVQGCGVGSKMMELIHEFCDHRQFRMIGLFTGSKNREFYEHHGYEWMDDVRTMMRKGDH